MYKIAFSSMALRDKLPDGDKRWRTLTKSFVNQELTITEILNFIFLGHPYTAWFDGGRKEDNFICSQFIAVDLDTDDERSTIEAVERNHFYRMYGGIVHTTPSHMTEGKGPRCRVVFLLDQPIMSSAGYRVAISTVYNFFEHADPSCIDPARFFYGNAKIQDDMSGITFADNILPLADLRRYAKQIAIQERQRLQQAEREYQQQQRNAPKASNAYAQGAFNAEVQALAQTGNGDRNNQLFKSAAALGNFVAAGLLDEESVTAHLGQAARKTGLPPAEIERTLRSGLRRGLQNPRVLQ